MTWPIKKLGEVLDLCDAGTWGTNDAKGMPLLRSTNMQNGNLVLDDLAVVDVSKDQKEKYTLREGDILMTKSSGSVDHIGKSLYITEEMDGKYGFSNFTQRLRVNFDLVIPKWVYYRVSSQAARNFLLDTSQTTTGLRNLKISKLKELEIPLPPLSEQKKIVARLEKLLAKVKEAKRLRAEARTLTQNLLSAELHKIFEEGKKKGWEEKELGKICELNPKKSEIKDEADNLSVSFVPMKAVDEYLQAITYQDEKSLGDVKKGYTYFRNGDVLFAKITPCMENGKIVIAKNLKNGIGFGTTEFHVIRSGKAILPEWVYYILRQPFFREKAQQKMTGSAGQKRVPVQFLEKYKILVPPLPEQKKIVARLDALSEKIKKLQEYQKSTQTDLDRLEQSILHSAFSEKAA